MAVPAITNNSPVVGSIAWASFTIQYNGVGYVITSGSTSQRWVWWRYNLGASVIEAGPDVPNDLVDDDLVLFGNKNGIGVRVQSATLIDGELLVDGSIFAAAISANAIVAGKIAAGAVTTDKMTANSIDGSVITSDTLSAAKIIAGSITTDKMTANTIDGSVITGSTLHGDKIIGESITAGKLYANSVTAEKIAAGAVTTDKMTANTINGTVITANTLSATKIVTDSITALQIEANTITAAEIKAGTLTSASGIFGALDASILTAGTIAAARIDTNSLTISTARITGLDADLATRATNTALTNGLATTVTTAATDATTKANLVDSKATSRGTDLVTNGSGTMGNNYNFSTWTYTAADAPTGAAGSFMCNTPNTQYSIYLDEFMPVDPNKKLMFAFQARQVSTSDVACMYGMLVPYDAFKNQISPSQYMFTPGTLTTLAVNLNPGDLTVTLTSSTNWYGSAGKPAGVNTHFRTFIFWDFTDAGGKLWLPQTYSRNFYGYDSYADGSLVGNVITLRVPWAGPAKVAGTQLSNGSSGGSFMYGGAVNTLIPKVWTPFSATVRGIVAAGTGGGASFSAGWPPGVSYTKAGFLVNYTTPANSRHAVAAVSLSDASAANAAALAADVKAQAVTTAVVPLTTAYNNWKNPADVTKIAGGSITTHSVSANMLMTSTLDATDITLGTGGVLKSSNFDANNGFQLSTSGLIIRGIGSTIDATAITVGTLAAARLAAGTITAASGIIADLAVTTAKIADANITTVKIADANITTAKILDANITNAKIANLAVTTAKITDANITTAKILDANITTAKINDLAVTSAKILTLTADKITTATMSAAVITISATGQIKSADYNGTTTGWSLSNGGLIIKTGTISASALEANSAVIGDIIIGRTADALGAIKSFGYALNTTGFKLDKTGLEMNTGTITGATVRTSVTATTAGVQMTSAGLFAYKASVPTVSILANGDATFTGVVNITAAGSSVPAATVSGPLVDSNIPVLTTAKIPNLDAAKITAGTLPTAVAIPAITVVTSLTNATIPTTTTISGGSITTGTIDAALATITNINATNITSGTIAAARIAAGTITAASGIIADLAVTTAKIADANITTAKILDANITTAKINDLAVTSAKINTLTADKIATGTLSAGIITLSATGQIKSADYNGTTTGWSLSNGGLIIKTGIISASALEANSAVIGDIIIGRSADALGAIKSYGYLANITGFKLDKTGLEVNNGTITGTNFKTAADGVSRIIMGPLATNAGAPSITWDLTGNGVDWAEPYISCNPTTKDLIISGKKQNLSLANLTLSESGNVALDSNDLISGNPASITLANGIITLVGKVMGHPYTVCGTTVATPSGSGNINIPYGVTFTTDPWPVCTSGSTGLFTVRGTAGTGGANGTATLYNAAGAVLTSGSYRVNWAVTGILA